ncbi:MAG: hypothetical protein K8F91_22470, partial [Candidatus Obscuribacterales bacterium]|nr:hypothetical protein [Candidatus Obscuribacterales bacterium]
MAVDFGLHPLSNRLLSVPNDDEFLARMQLGSCASCGVIQLVDPPSPEELKPRQEWISYTEPERHLDAVVEQVARLANLGKDDLVLGLSEIDKSTLDRLEQKGFTCVHQLSLRKDLDKEDVWAGLETICSSLPGKIDSIKNKYGAPKLILARFILEHAQKTNEFLSALKRLIDPDGYILFEVPDCRRIFESCDYSFMWEEHSIYFTEASLLTSLVLSDFYIESFQSYSYPYENTLSAIVEIEQGKTEAASGARVLLEEQDLLKFYAVNLPTIRYQCQQALRDYRSKNGKVAVFGAGHLAISFVNLLGLKDLIDVVI